MAGVNNLKKVMEKTINFGMALRDSLEDKRITVTEGVGLLANLVGFGTVLLNWREVKEEYKDLDDQEREEILDHLKQAFALENDRVEAIVEESFEVLLVVDKFTLNFRK